jgi:hypothetical protein
MENGVDVAVPVIPTILIVLIFSAEPNAVQPLKALESIEEIPSN